MDWQQIGKWVLGICAALATAGIVIKFGFNRKSNSSERTTIQSNNKAGRDIIGGDKIDKR